MSPIEIQTSVCALLFMSVCVATLFFSCKLFAWRYPNYNRVNKFMKLMKYNKV
jgi:hypothetical protein